MTKLSTRVRAPIKKSKKIYTVDQSEPGFYLATWIEKFKENCHSSKYYWIFKDEISLYSKEYKEFLGESVFRDVLLDVKKYGSWIGFLS